jgi:FMN-dependent NADH-azoreductase
LPHLLHLDTSARPASFSRSLGARFAERWRRHNPAAEHRYRDLAADPVPLISPGWTDICDELLRRGITEPARYAEVLDTEAERAAWAVCGPLLAELLAADLVLIGTPMYNFGVPAALKAWIDQVTFPKMTLPGTRFVVLSARGGSYRPGTPRAHVDHQERYHLGEPADRQLDGRHQLVPGERLERDFFAGHFGVTDATFVATELTNSMVDPRLAELAEAHRESHAAALAEIDRLTAPENFAQLAGATGPAAAS